MASDDQLTPTPRDGAPVIVAAVEGIVLTWVGVPEGEEGHGEIAGDGSTRSRRLIATAKRMWDDPQPVDHPTFKHAITPDSTVPAGALATLWALGQGRTIILQAPDDLIDAVFQDPPAPDPAPAPATSDDFTVIPTDF